MERFPTVRDLATAHLDNVLKAWEGLGYYRRAVNLHRAAATVMDTYGGRVPTDPEELLDLPGVGHYTAAAVATFAAGQPLLPVDANVRRVAARLFTLSGAAGPQTVKKYLQRNLGAQNPGSTAEALMELGALVCTPRSPRCGACPLSPSCKAYQLGRATDFPERRGRRERPQRFRFAAVIIRKGKMYLERRPEGGLLGGTWGFPQISTPPNRCSLLNPVQTWLHPLRPDAHPGRGRGVAATRWVRCIPQTPRDSRTGPVTSGPQGARTPTGNLPLRNLIHFG